MHPERWLTVLLLRRARARRLLPRSGERRTGRDLADAKVVEMRKEGQGHRQGGGGRNGRVAMACEFNTYLFGLFSGIFVDFHGPFS